ncbi:thioesterase II family protein [Streptomyces sp. ISL-11]|uniref:thioesterase II family protein n=1 Tax=Streptomyces sp. ISL-11 TaxID=2819174 RepID=UPI001BE9B87A|nr:alpha/beta fold hydrolase [Streptomyces sp. ISL-11]MBT2384273.1 thioesterase [Streptomyces sp. ISL-11]
MTEPRRTAPTSRWIAGGALRQAPLKLYCFPHAGGSAAEYIRWGKEIPGVEVYAVQLPGRASRFAEQPLTSMDHLVEALLREVEFTGTYAFFGHSMGSLVAYELTCALREAGRPLPRRLFVSSGAAPDAPRKHAGLHLMPRDEMLAAVHGKHGGIPDEVFAHPELKEMVAVGLRADYTVLETYAWRPRAPLPVPLTVLAGDREPLARDDSLTGWGRHTTYQPVTVRTFPGGHFYLREQPGPVVQRMLAELLGVGAAT